MDAESTTDSDGLRTVQIKMKSLFSFVEMHKIGLIGNRGLPRILPAPNDYDKYRKISLFFTERSGKGMYQLIYEFTCQYRDFNSNGLTSGFCRRRDLSNRF